MNIILTDLLTILSNFVVTDVYVLFNSPLDVRKISYITEPCCLHTTQPKKHLGLHTAPEGLQSFDSDSSMQLLKVIMGDQVPFQSSSKKCVTNLLTWVGADFFLT